VRNSKILLATAVNSHFKRFKSNSLKCTLIRGKPLFFVTNGEVIKTQLAQAKKIATFFA
jgi:hypothetical protein